MAIAKQNADRATKNVALLVSTLGSFVTPLMNSSINIALPAIAREFKMDAILLSWIPTLSILAAAVFLVPLGRISDIYGRKKIFTYGIMLFTAASILAAMSSSALMLIAFRILQGIGSAMTFGTSIAILTSVFRPGERGRVLGINTAVVYLGLSVGPFLGGIMTEHFGWRSVFLLNVPLGITVIAGVYWRLKGEWLGAEREKFDLVGSLIYGVAIVAIMYGVSILPGNPGVATVAAGIAGILIFSWYETRVNSPILHMDLILKNPTFAFSNVATVVNYASSFAVSFLLSLYLQHIKRLSPESAGLLLLVMPAVQTVFSVVAGHLSDRNDPRLVASSGMAFTTVGLVILCFLDANTPLPPIVVSLAILGVGLGLFSAPNTNAIMSSVENKYYGVASSMLAAMRQIGMMLSLGISMLIFAIYIGRAEITPPYYPVFVASLRPAFIIFAVLCFGGIFASLARGKSTSEGNISRVL